MLRLTLTPIRSGLAYRAAIHTSSNAAGPSRPRRTPVEQSDDVDLVAPPDPVSNIRPMIYAHASRLPTLSSPYSSAEFPYAEKDAKMQDLELEWRLRKERLDVMNHKFWAATNLDFQARLANRLAALPSASDPPTDEQTALREEVMSQFYADWLAANKYKQVEWVKVWWRELWASLKMDLRLHIARRTRFFRQ
ncbi:hypothetical protein BD324DRAFT_651599 [Kockovaella imperatae]|uniref:Uncharacterized protein n=1 Tax=Kockovaella imperatae TaxID=4999 RepID=A0A1Y1UE79_9TREE|nr:hypothetical protein BD324DRAFT_651599 [Kockovaella imperatae]ORX36360.1 hypothetical protein BD324DRAFT_651599 [Kockovaella imperatae]